MPIELKPVTLNELPLLQEQLPKLQNGDCNLSIASVTDALRNTTSNGEFLRAN